jgi:hypothetical protein
MNRVRRSLSAELARRLTSLAPRPLTTCFRATGGSEAPIQNVPSDPRVVTSGADRKLQGTGGPGRAILRLAGL